MNLPTCADIGGLDLKTWQGRQAARELQRQEIAKQWKALGQVLADIGIGRTLASRLSNGSRMAKVSVSVDELLELVADTVRGFQMVTELMGMRRDDLVLAIPDGLDECASCGVYFVAARGKQYCSPTCRQRAWHDRRKLQDARKPGARPQQRRKA